MKPVIGTLLLFGFVLVAACSGNPEHSKYCAVVATKSVKDDLALFEIFDRFAVAQGFERYSADPGAHAYRKVKGALEIDVMVGLGDLGSVVVFYNSSKSKTVPEQQALEQFLTSTVGTRWGYKTCDQVKDFHPP